MNTLRLRASRHQCWTRWKWALVILALSVSCRLISDYDAVSFKTATDLKAECLVMIERSGEGPPGDFKDAIDDLKLKLRKAYEYEKGKSLNSETAKQWEIMIDRDRNMMGGFLKFWEEKNAKLGGMFIGEFSAQVTDGFNEIIRLENAKRKTG